MTALTRRRFAGNREAENVLDQAERHADADQSQLAQHLRAAGAPGDEELIRAAQALLKQADPVGAKARLESHARVTALARTYGFPRCL